MRLVNTLIAASLITVSSIVILLFTGQAFAQDKAKKLSPRSESFLTESSLTMLTYEGALETCVYDVMPENKKMMEVQQLWAEKYRDMTYELLYYKAKQWSETLQDKPDNKDDFALIEEAFISLSDDSISKNFSGLSDKKAIAFCDDLQKISMKDAGDVFHILETGEREILVDMYGPYNRVIDK